MGEIIFEGIYHDYLKASQHALGEGFSTHETIERATSKLEKFRLSHLQDHCPSIPIGLRISSLPLFLATREFNRPLIVLDFGGSVGFGYETLNSCCPTVKIKRYDIIESPEICRAGSCLFELGDPIHFYSEIPSEIHYDIVYMNSSLQYVCDYKSLLLKLAKQSSYLLIDDLPAGSIPDFVSVQKYYDSRIPHRFFSYSRFVLFMKQSGIQLLYNNIYLGAILGKIQGYPMGNFPKEYQLQYSSTLCFKSSI